MLPLSSLSHARGGGTLFLFQAQSDVELWNRPHGIGGRYQTRQPQDPWIDAPNAPSRALAACMTSSGTMRASHLQICDTLQGRLSCSRLLLMHCSVPRRGMPRIPTPHRSGKTKEACRRGEPGKVSCAPIGHIQQPPLPALIASDEEP